MPVHIQHEKGSNYVSVALTGKLNAEDYHRSVPILESYIDQYGKLNVMVHLVAFEGWTVAAAFRDLAFDFKHRGDVQRVAVVGERKWQHWLTTVGQPFTSGELKYFEAEQMDAAIAWLKGHQYAVASA